MLEFFEDMLVDADIIIDYKKMTVDFKNKQYLSESIEDGFKFMCKIFIPFLIFFHFIVYKMEYDIYYSIFSVSLLFGVCFIFCVITVMINSSNNKFIRNIVFNRKTRRILHKIEIENPEGVVTYTTRSSEPFIDLEYDPDVKDSLESVSLIKETKKILLYGEKQIRQVLTIKFSRKAEGSLTIIEY